MINPNLPPPSPCIDVCELDSSGLCRGCHRSGNEIAIWSRLDAASQWQIIEQCKQRAAARTASK